MTSTLMPRAVTAASDAEFVERPSTRKLGLSKPIPFGRLIGVGAFLGVWILGSILHLLDPRKLSPPWQVVTTGWGLLVDGQLIHHVGASLTRAMVGLAIGLAIGITLALISGLSRWGEYFVDGPVQLNRVIPSLGLIPLMIVWVGIGETFKIAIIVLNVLVHIYMQLHTSLTKLDKRYVELAEVLGVNRATFIRKVAIPGSYPGFFLGLRLAVASSWLTLIIVESVNATDGLGKLMKDAQLYGQSDVILVGLAVYGIFGLTSDAVVRLLERKVLSWQRTMES